ncbi:ribonucleases P/MRP protein subunit POP1-domain-containing protein [Phakopsora pachyrhizi]|nr:ribonucleases P/MRP protein subunit POP1-domain-containing protein [Phakopsora pachyrhizi]
MASENQSSLKRPIRSLEPSTSSQARKRAKLKNSRQIDTQDLKDIQNNHENLPQFLNVEKFISSRTFEINAMEKALRTARQGTGQRAFQTLPRHLRRRAASHFARRVPTRLREKARFEMKNDKKKSPSRAVKIKLKAKQFHDKDRTKKLQKRQVEKKWLRTHLWHAKRTKMIDIWGYRLAKKPTEKCFRSTYRAAKYGATLHDLSYYTHLSLIAQENDLMNVMARICDPMGADPSSAWYRAGHRCVEVMIYDDGGWPMCLIGPAVIIWRPITNEKPVDDLHQQTRDLSCTLMDFDAASGLHNRELMIQAHPSLKLQIIEAVKRASNSNIVPQDLNELGCLELGGPKCTEMLGRVLKGERKEEKREVVEWLRAGIRCNTFPIGMLIGITVDDPRIHFPDKRKEHTKDVNKSSVRIIQPQVRYSDCPRFWDQEEQKKSIKYKKADIDKRRSKLEIPGSRLERIEADDRISILILRSDLGWRIIMPFKWTQSFFYSFVFATPRLVCLDQRAQIDFEASKPSFPKDFPCLLPAAELAERAGTEEFEYWHRCPPAKRVNYRLMDSKGGGGGGDPFVADWKLVIRGENGSKKEKKSKDKEAQKIPDQESEIIKHIENQNEPWLMIGPLIGLIVEKVIKLTMVMIERNKSNEEIMRLAPGLIEGLVNKFKPINPQQDQSNAQIRWENAIVQVRIEPSGGKGKKGVISDLARIYWKKDVMHQVNEECERLKRKKNRHYGDFIGLVTTGQFSLSEASMIGFGAVSLKKIVEMIISKT